MTVTEDLTTAEPDPFAEQAETPEVIDQRPREISAGDSALERAAEAALTLPGIPGRDEFIALAMQARILAMSGAAPVAVRNNPHLAFHIAMVGRDLGISPSAALNLVDVIESKKGPQLSLSPQLINGQIIRLGLGKIVPELRSDERCVALAVGPGGLDPRCARRLPEHDPDCRCDVLGRSEFSWSDAQAAGLAMHDCRPKEHTARCRTYSTPGHSKCNTGYQNWPARMLWWRAAGFAGDDFYPEASIGLYSPEALGAVVDADGRPIDPADVELPTGYEPRAIAPPAPVQPADPAAVEQLRATVARFGVAARRALAVLWTNTDPETGAEVREGAEPLPHLGDLSARQLPRAKAMVASIEARCKRGEFEWTAPGDEKAPETAQDGQEAPAPAETAPESPQAPAAAQEPESAAETAGDEDAGAEAAVARAHEEAWSAKLPDVRKALTAFGVESAGTPEEVRNRLETELLRRDLAEVAPELPAEAPPASSLMDALAQDVTPEG